MASQRIFLGICFFLLIEQRFIKTSVLFKSIQVILAFSIAYFGIELLNLGGFNSNQLYKVHNFFVHKNLFASFLLFGFLLSIVSIKELKHNWKKLATINSVLTLTSILVLQNRTVFLALFAAGFFYLLIYSKKTRLFLSIITLLCSLSIASFLFFGNSKSLKNISLLSLDSIEERIKLWDKTVEIIKENPTVGVGAGNWQFNFAKYSVNDVYMIHQDKTNFQKPHNDYLWVLSETGILGFSLLIVALFFLIQSHRWIKFNWKKKVLFSSLIAYGVISFFSFPSERIIHLFLFILVIHLLIESKQVIVIKLPGAVNLILVLGLIFNLIIGSFNGFGQYHTKKLLEAKLDDDFLKVIEHGESALSPFYLTDPTSTPIASYLGFAHHNLDNPDLALYYAEQAHLIAPYDFELLSNYGSQLIKFGNYDKAEQVLLEAYRINKYNDPIKLNLMTLNYNQQNYWQALKWLEKIPNYKIKHPDLLDRITKKLSF